MNYRITTSSYFDATAKKLAKKYPSFKDDLINFGKTLLENPLQGAELAPGIVSVSAMLYIHVKKNIAQAFILERYFFVSICPAAIPGTCLSVFLAAVLLLC